MYTHFLKGNLLPIPIKKKFPKKFTDYTFSLYKVTFRNSNNLHEKFGKTQTNSGEQCDKCDLFQHSTKCQCQFVLISAILTLIFDICDLVN